MVNVMDAREPKSERILRMIKQMRLEESVVDVNVKFEKLVIFSLAGELFAFAGRLVKEILICQEISFVPGSPGFLLGVMNVRGDIESVASLAVILGIPQLAPSALNRILIVEDDHTRSGILVDKVEDVIDVPFDSIKPPLVTMNGLIAENLKGETVYRGRTVLVLDITKVFKRFGSDEQ